MTARPGAKSQSVSQHGEQPPPPIAVALLPIWLLIGFLALMVPWLPLRAVVIVGWGVLIFTYERYLNLPVPVTPGTMFWFGCTLSYVVGGLGTDLVDRSLATNFLYAAESAGFGMRYLDSALLYLGLGLG